MDFNIVDMSFTETIEKELFNVIYEALEKEFLENETLEKETLENETLEKETLENETLENETLEKETLENETLENETLEKETLENETLENETLEKETLENETLEKITNIICDDENISNNIEEIVMENMFENYIKKLNKKIYDISGNLKKKTNINELLNNLNEEDEEDKIEKLKLINSFYNENNDNDKPILDFLCNIEKNDTEILKDTCNENTNNKDYNKWCDKIDNLNMDDINFNNNLKDIIGEFKDNNYNKCNTLSLDLFKSLDKNFNDMNDINNLW